ncbi:uncharacterized protein LOC135959039 [Calliphora vicina]|uniref:uncharacterized protein LOC135959039 n=1 Tax=Calliphora vicina TaxID=7373 RepID=UPI00325C0B43
MEINSKMTRSNFNKIMQANLKLNSKILSKNTNEIVNTCIGKMYKQMPLTFKNGLQQGKIGAAVKSENHGPLKKLKFLDRKCQQTAANKPLKAKANIYETQMQSNLMSKKPAALTPRKLLETSSNKIFNIKRYCSSASSSSGSIFYHKDDKPSTTRAYHTASTNSLDKSKQQRSSSLQHKSASLMISNHNQYINSNVDTMQRAMKVSGRMQRDLMAIDELLKTRVKVSAKCQDFKAANDNKTNKVWRTLPTNGIDNKHLKENWQMFKERSMPSLPIVEAEKNLKNHKRLSRTSVGSRDLPDKGNQQKINLRKHFCSSTQKQDNLCVPVLGNSSPKQPSEGELLKPYKLKRIKNKI